MNQIDASIIIPCRNEEANIHKCLVNVFSQKTKWKYEVIAIDSGSTDQTTNIIASFKQVKLFKINPDEFAHGKTRNFGAENAIGKYLVFLNADAIPIDDQWLNNLLAPFKKEEHIAGVYSRHLPNENCFLYMKRDLESVMPEKSFIRDKNNKGFPMLFSTVSAAIKSDIWQEYKFNNEILYAEDQEWAGRVLKAGFKIAYASNSAVYHSHNYNSIQLFKIKFLYGKTLKRFFYQENGVFKGFMIMILGIFIKLLNDLVFIFLYKAGFAKKIKEAFISLFARIASFSGRYFGQIFG